MVGIPATQIIINVCDEPKQVSPKKKLYPIGEIIQTVLKYSITAVITTFECGCRSSASRSLISIS
jgi:hypothetical protein